MFVTKKNIIKNSVRLRNYGNNCTRVLIYAVPITRLHLADTVESATYQEYFNLCI